MTFGLTRQEKTALAKQERFYKPNGLFQERFTGFSYGVQGRFRGLSTRSCGAQLILGNLQQLRVLWVVVKVFEEWNGRCKNNVIRVCSLEFFRI